ncbi:MAG: zinc-binding dehydrogenase [Peptostreptococcales bacterium]
MRYKAAVVLERGKVEIQEFEKAKLDRRDVMVKVLLAGVCGTDVHLVYDEREEPFQKFKLGHEWVGVIDEMGTSAPQYDVYQNPIKVGDRIIAYPSTWADGTCYACRILLQPNLCMRTGVARDIPDMGSAYAEYMYIPGESVFFKIPDDISNEEAVLIEPIAGALRAFERAFSPGVPDRNQGFGPGKSVVIAGTGSIGTIMTAIAKMAGAYPIIAIGGPENRLELCKKFGADLTIDINSTTRTERIETVRDSTLYKLGADVVLECAGVPEAFLDGIRMARQGGTLVEFGHYTKRGTIPIDPFEICEKDIQIFGSWGYGPQEFGSAINILKASHSRGIDFSKLVTHRFALKDAQEALEKARKFECTKAVIEC